MKHKFTKLMAIIAVLLMSAWSVKAQTYHAITGEETVPLIKSNVDAQDFLSATNNWATNKNYCGYSGETIFNMSSVGRILTIDVSNVANFDLLVHNSTAGRSFDIKIGDGTTQKITHDGTNCVTFSFSTGNTGNITIKLEGDGSGSVYPSTIILYPPALPSITKFVAEGVEATIDENAKTITAELPYGTSLTSIEPVVTIGGTATGYSPTGAQDFTSPVTYTATDGTNNVNYTVTLTVNATPSSDKDLSDVTIGGVTPTFDAGTNTYSVILPKSSDITQPVVFTIPITASADFTSGNSHDFTNPLSIKVTAQDASTKVYTLTAQVGSKNIAYVTLTTGNDDPYLYGSLLAKGYYVEKVIAVDQPASFFDDFDLSILFDVVGSGVVCAQNMGLLIGTKRFLNLKAYMYGKTNWPTGSGVNYTDPNAIQSITVAGNYTSHPIFNGLTFSDFDLNLVDAGGTYRALQGVANPDNGEIVATIKDKTDAGIIENNTNQSAMYLSIGFANGGAAYGLANISADGKKLLDNAVEYLLGDVKYSPVWTGISNSLNNSISFDGRTIFNPERQQLYVYSATGSLVASSVKDINMSAHAKGVYLIKGESGMMKIAVTK